MISRRSSPRRSSDGRGGWITGKAALTQEDVRSLLRLSPERLREIRDHLAEHAPDLAVRLAEVLGS